MSKYIKGEISELFSSCSSKIRRIQAKYINNKKYTYAWVSYIYALNSKLSVGGPIPLKNCPLAVLYL